MGQQSRRHLIDAEFARLGLRPIDMPYQALATGPGGGFLEHLRTLSPGATWHDVFPGLPASWQPGMRLEFPERPIGDFDQPDPPRGGVITIVLADGRPESSAHALVKQIREHGSPVYGYGLDKDARDPIIVRVILDASADEHVLWDTVDWLETLPDVQGTAVPRSVPEQEAS